MPQVVILGSFTRYLKPYLKKYRRLKGALIAILEQFHAEQHVSLGQGVYKVRLTTPDLKKGKSNSFRLIVMLIEQEQLLVPLALYYKGDQESISLKTINDMIEQALLELRLVVK